MRISDWSSDVCSSDLGRRLRRRVLRHQGPGRRLANDSVNGGVNGRLPSPAADASMAPRPSESIMTSASTMSGGEAVVRSLIANGLDTIFGLPGVQPDHFFNALHDHGNELRVLNARHAQGTAYMAFRSEERRVGKECG